MIEIEKEVDEIVAPLSQGYLEVPYFLEKSGTVNDVVIFSEIRVS